MKTVTFIILLLLTAASYSQGGSGSSEPITIKTTIIPDSNTDIFTECGWGNAYIIQTIHTSLPTKLCNVETYIVNTEIVIKYLSVDSFDCSGSWIVGLFSVSGSATSSKGLKTEKVKQVAKAFEMLEFLKEEEH